MICQFCDAPVSTRRKFCSNTCRQKAYLKRRKFTSSMSNTKPIEELIAVMVWYRDNDQSSLINAYHKSIPDLLCLLYGDQRTPVLNMDDGSWDFT